MVYVSGDYSLKARELNENFVGRACAVQARDGSAVFARIAAIRITDSGTTTIWFDSVPGESGIRVMELGPETQVQFSRTEGEWEIREFVGEIRDILKKHLGQR
jgi:hypothetical protein